MKREMNPIVIVATVVVLVLGLGLWLFKDMQPATYKPSPGADGTPMAALPNEGKMPVGYKTRHVDPLPPANVTPGDPTAIKH